MSSRYMPALIHEPGSREWPAILKWIIAVMDEDDTSLAFAAGCLVHALKNNGLTASQTRACERLHDRIYSAYAAGVLDCQQEHPPHDLASIKTQGEA